MNFDCDQHLQQAPVHEIKAIAVLMIEDVFLLLQTASNQPNKWRILMVLKPFAPFARGGAISSLVYTKFNRYLRNLCAMPARRGD
jgi:hypothetical protein